MLKRKILQKLHKWHDSDQKKAPLLYGARQVGKTTAVREFARECYPHFVEVNFVRTPSVMRAFDGDLSTTTILTNLSAMGLGPFIKHETLVFFDEIQECPNARTALKFLVEEHYCDYIASGSLLGINYKPVTSYPVGFEERYDVYPMDFEEFLWAKGVSDEVIEVLRKSLLSLTPVPSFIHEQMSRFYREYLVVGGMPEVVQQYVSDPNFSEVERLQQAILSTYRADITHYAGHQAPLVKRVFDALPSQLGKQDKRFILASLEKGASNRKYMDPTQWLIDAGIAYYSFNIGSFERPFEAYENRRLYKLYMVDTGLLCSQLLTNMQFEVMNGDIGINEGALTENFVACTLAANNHSLHYYDKKSRLELDFVLQERDGIAIVEVKSGDDYTRHASLNHAMNDYGNLISRSIVLSKNNIAFRNGILYIPLYMAGIIF